MELKKLLNDIEEARLDPKSTESERVYLKGALDMAEIINNDDSQAKQFMETILKGRA